MSSGANSLKISLAAVLRTETAAKPFAQQVKHPQHPQCLVTIQHSHIKMDHSLSLIQLLWNHNRHYNI